MAKKIHDFSEVLGHANVVNYLQRSIEKDKVPDVMIFHGNAGIGKSTLARLVAIAVTTKFKPSIKDAYTISVIDNETSTDSIKMFNMSSIQEKEEEIQKVKAELTVGFSSTGRKVLILDEAHGMSKVAQDAILPELEHLPEGIWVFMCTTEIGVLREPLLSRSKATIRLNDLCQRDMQKLIKNAIKVRGLTFNMSLDMVVALITSWTSNRPRNAYNMIDAFEEGSLVTSAELSVFIDVNSTASLVELLKYIYGSMVMGISYLDGLKYEPTLPTMLIEILKVALGGNSVSVGKEDTRYIRAFMQDKNINNFIQFTAEVAAMPTVRKRQVIAAFLRANAEYKVDGVPMEEVKSVSMMEDIKRIEENIERTEMQVSARELNVQSIEEMMGTAETLA